MFVLFLNLFFLIIKFKFETPYETHIRNVTSERVKLLKNKIIAQLWTIAKYDQLNSTTFDNWSTIANSGLVFFLILETRIIIFKTNNLHFKEIL